MPYLLCVYRYPYSFFHSKALFSFLTSILIVPHSATFPNRSLWSANAFSLLSPLTTYFSAFILLSPPSHFFLLSHAQGLSFALRLNILYLNRLQHSLFLSFVNRPSHQLAFSLPSLFFYLRPSLSLLPSHTHVFALSLVFLFNTHIVFALSRTHAHYNSLYILSHLNIFAHSLSLFDTHTHSLTISHSNYHLTLLSFSTFIITKDLQKKLLFAPKCWDWFFFPRVFSSSICLASVSSTDLSNGARRRRRRRKKERKKEEDAEKKEKK